MTIEEQFDNIYKYIESRKLSAAIPIILPLALEQKDYIGFCEFLLWDNPIKPTQDENQELIQRIKNQLIIEGVSPKVVDKMLIDAYTQVTHMRMNEKGNISPLSVAGIEDQLDTVTKIFAMQIPLSIRAKSLESEKELKLLYNNFKSFLISKIVQYRREIYKTGNVQNQYNKKVSNKNIFIIHGHNEAKLRELKDLLSNQFKLNPIILSEQPDQGLTIIEKFEKYATECAYAFALFTPDHIVSDGQNEYFQARPNVIFELGWFYSCLGRSNVCVLYQESNKNKIFSDLDGVVRMQFKENICEKYLEIEKELKAANILL